MATGWKRSREQHQQERRLSLEQLVEIAEGHRQREDALVLDASRFMFVDTDARTTRQFALDYHGRSHPRLDQLADAAGGRYNLVFLCEDDIPYDDTEDRSGEAHRGECQARVRADLVERGVEFVSLRGDLSERVEQVSAVLGGPTPDITLGKDAEDVL